MKLSQLTAWSLGIACVALIACNDDGKGSGDPLFDVHGSDDDGYVPPQDTSNNGGSGTEDASGGDTTQQPPDDLIPDTTPPTVVSVTPKDGAGDVAFPLQFTLEFSEELARNTISADFIQLRDWRGKVIEGVPTLSQDLKKVVWNPKNNNQEFASEYQVFVNGRSVKDRAGNAMGIDFKSHFRTVSYPNQDSYAALAKAYAPDIYTAVDSKAAQIFQIPVKFDADGNWDVTDNRQWLSTANAKIDPAVYYTVTETVTHYFIQYSFYFPYINHDTDTYQTGNGLTALTIVVEKARGENDERPIAAYHFWKEKGNTYNYAYATEESNLVPSSKAWGFLMSLPEADLFPNGRYQALITAHSHRMCNRDYGQTGTAARCTVPGPNDDLLKLAYTNGSSTRFKKVEFNEGMGAQWPSNMDEAGIEAYGYSLNSLWDSLWARRGQDQPRQVFDMQATLNYSPDTDRPGEGLVLPSQFLQDRDSSALDSFGKPPWAFKAENYGNGSEFEIATGTSAIDPAWYMYRRHRGSGEVANAVEAYNEETGEGFSTEYCFNGFLHLDERQSNPLCEN